MALVAACGAAAPPSPPPSPSNAPSATARAPAPTSTEPTATATVTAIEAGAPPEPWFHDKDDAFEECITPPATVRVALPAPYDRCDGAAEAWSSPPGGNELHFHYRAFSAAVTRARRDQTPDVCCYLIWEFPRRGP